MTDARRKELAERIASLPLVEIGLEPGRDFGPPVQIFGYSIDLEATEAALIVAALRAPALPSEEEILTAISCPPGCQHSGACQGNLTKARAVLALLTKATEAGGAVETGVKE